MQLRATIYISICCLVLIGCASFPSHPDRNPTIWEVISAYTNPATPAPAQAEADGVAMSGENGEDTTTLGTPTATLLPGTRVAVAQTRVHTERLTMTAEAAPPTATLLPGTRVAVAQTRVHTTRVAMTAESLTATAAPTGTQAMSVTVTPGSGTQVAVLPTKADATPSATATRIRPTNTPVGSTPRPTATSVPSTPTQTATPTEAATSAATPTRSATSTPGETPTLPPSPPEDPIRRAVYIRSHVGSAESGEYVVVGEIINGEDYPVYGARVVGTFYDGSGNTIGAQEEMAIFPKTHTEQPNPFRLAVSDPAGQVESYDLNLVWEDISVVEFMSLTVVSAEVDDDEKLEISGELRNDQSSELTSIIVTVTFYDEDGAVIAAYDDFFGSQTLGPGESMPYTLTIPDAALEYDTFYVQAQGNLNLF